MHAHSDEDLMAAYVAGREEAFQEIFRRYAPLLLRILRRELAAGSDAEDLVQLAFLHFHRARNDFRPDKRLRPWIIAIALNVKRDFLRRQRRQAEGQRELAREAVVAAQGEVSGEAGSRIRTALRHLPDGQREVLELHWFDGFSFAEIAQIVDASLSAVKVRAHRGYGRLRQLLGSRRPDVTDETRTT